MLCVYLKQLFFLQERMSCYLNLALIRENLEVGRFNKNFFKKKMTNKVYVGSLSFDTTEDALKDLFAEAGKVDSVSIIIDKFSGRSKGFAFVEMSSEEEAKKAIEMLNGKELDGRTLIVDEAKPMADKPFKKFSGDRKKFDRKRF